MPASIASLREQHSRFWNRYARRVRCALSLALLILVLVVASGCGGGSTVIAGSTPTPTPLPTPAPTPSSSTAVTLGFFGTPPDALGVQMGTGPFTSVAPPSSPTGVTSFSVPNGISKYVIAYLCRTAGSLQSPPLSNEFMIEATLQDATSLKVDCSGNVTFLSGAAPTLGSVSGNMDATAFPNSKFVHISGKQGFSGSADLLGPFTASLPAGTNDIAFVLLDNGGNLAVLGKALGIKIFRDQTVPGTVNGGNTITFGSNDFPPNQQLNVNAPAGFVVDGQLTEVTYTTAGGTVFPLENGSAIYQSVPQALVQTGDFYSYGSEAATAGGASAVGIYQATSNGGGLFTLNLPDPWSPSNPPANGSPVIFTFDYPGFPGIPTFAQRAELNWQTQCCISANSIMVTATANFQNGANTISIPDPSLAGQGFFTCCPSSMNIGWSASILGATAPLSFLESNFKAISIRGGVLPAGASAAFVHTSGGFTTP